MRLGTAKLPDAKEQLAPMFRPVHVEALADEPLDPWLDLARQ